MAKDTTAKKGVSSKNRRTIEMIILTIIIVCIALILVELYGNVMLELAS